MKHTPGPWVVDDGMVTMEDQAQQLKEDIGTKRQWVAIGLEDEDGFSEVVALAHPSNALLIASAPDLLETCKQLLNRIDYHGSIDPIREEGPLEDLRQAITKAEGK